MKSIRIGNGCGFWGDNLEAPIILAQRGNLDYLTLEYLAELTMSILALQKLKDPNTGYATDFLDVLAQLVPALRSQPRLKIITNAGGMNPLACARKAKEILSGAGLDDAIAVVDGDDLMPRLDQLAADGHALDNFDSGEPLASVRSRIVSANAYLGARPIVEGLAKGARVVITGRVADASLTVAPAVHAFNWDWQNWDRLAAATVAGHLIECGAQATGGLWCNWQEAEDLGQVGYPIAEITSSGMFEIQKPPGTGGAVNRETIIEQLLYEVADPAAYMTPDVVADFTSIRVTQSGMARVMIENARGKPATDSYKVSMAYRDGFMSSGMLTLVGPDSVTKARRAGAMILDRLARANATPARHLIECLGAGDCVPSVLRPACYPVEVVLRVAVHDGDRKKVDRFTKELAPLVTSGPVGVTGYATGRPQVREVFAYWPALIAKHAVEHHVSFL